MPQVYIEGIKLCTPADVKNLSTIHPAYDGRNDAIESFIRAATSQCIEHCNRDMIAQTGVVEYFSTPNREGDWLNEGEVWSSGADGYSVYLREPNISNLKVWLNYRNTFDDKALLTVDKNFVTENYGPNRLLTKLSLFVMLRAHARALKISYDSGFPVDAEDAFLYKASPGVTQAVALQTGFLMSRASVEDIGTGDVGGRRATARRDPRTTPGGVTSEVQFLLRGFRRNLTGSM